MLGFKEYITEIFDRPYPFIHTKTVHMGDMSSHIYHIHAPSGNKFKVHITHDKSDGSSEVGFEDHEGEISLTGKLRHQAHGVISAVANAVKHHVKTTPTVKSVKFEGFKGDNDEHTGRTRLYKAITAKLGGETHDRSYFTRHRIPADNIRAA